MRTQIELFPKSEEMEIPGATYLRDFVSLAEERELISHIEQGTWTHEFARRRQHYGIRRTGPGRTFPLPAWIEMIARRIVKARLFRKMPVQALVNEYLPGLSTLRRGRVAFPGEWMLDGFVKANRTNAISIWLEPRSLLVLTGEARHEWTHAIRPRLADVVNGAKIPRQRRLSLTLRTLAT
jgi:alkylated DNA repair dioxygenase AlkB